MTRPSPLACILATLIRGYRLVSGLLPPRCRFYPSCSAYGLEAIETHGAIRGSWLAVRRITRCHPWNPGGIDRVPARPHTHNPQENTCSHTTPQGI